MAGDDKTAVSRNLAGLIGPPLILIPASQALNLGIFQTNIPLLTYLDGMIIFVVGLAIVRAHNIWVLGWRVLITVLAWAAMAVGLSRMFLPNELPPSSGIGVWINYGVSVLIGALFCYQGYKPQR